MSIREKMKADLIAAMKSKQREVVSLLRTTLGTIDNAEAVSVETPIEYENGRAKDVPRKILTDADIQNILQGEANARSLQANQYLKLGKEEESARLQQEAEILKRYLQETPR